MKYVLFVCTHNAGRSQMAEALFERHAPREINLLGVLFVNCGSVGKPKDGDPRAAFVALTPTDQGVQATIERADYDAEAVARQVAAAGLPEEYADKLVAAA